MTQRAQTGLLALTLHVERLFPYELMNLLIPCSSPLVSFSVVFSMPLCSNSSLASRFRAGAWRCSEQRFRLRFRLCRSRNRAGGLLRGARSRGSFRTSPVCMIFRISNRGLCTVLSCSLVGGESSPCRGVGGFHSAAMRDLRTRAYEPSPDSMRRTPILPICEPPCEGANKWTLQHEAHAVC